MNDPRQEPESPPNWVRMRAQCNPDAYLSAIRTVVERDVEEANKLPAAPLEEAVGGFELVIKEGTGGRRSFCVLRKPRMGLAPQVATVWFTQTETTVEVEHKNASGQEVDSFKVSISWDAREARCVSRLGPALGREIAPWEVSRRALEALIFQD